MKLRVIVILGLLAWIAVPIANAQAGGPYAMSWNTLSSGGGTIGSGPYQLSGSIGQPDAGILSSGGYALNGGFWSPGGAGTVAVDPVREPVPSAFAAHAPMPNPFLEGTTFAFDLPAPSRVRLAIFGVDGRRVRLLMDGEREVGRHRVVWNGRDDQGLAAPAGVYFARITAGTFTASQRIVRLD